MTAPLTAHLPTTVLRESRALSALVLIAAMALIYILLPFYGAIMWGSILALLFAPMFRWLLRHVGQRSTLAALLTMLIVLVVVVLPLLLVGASLVREATAINERLQSGELKPALYFRSMFDALPDWVTAVLDRFGLVSFNTLQRRLIAALTQGTQLIATQTFSIGQNIFEFVASVFITLYLAFFLIRDGHAAGRAMWDAMPLANAHKVSLRNQFTTVVRATVKGNLLVAAIQGALGGLGFWALGVSGAVLWAVLMAFLSLLPTVGASLVWLPVAIYFLLAGELGKSLVLAAYGVLVIGLVDNLLRPILVGKDTRMPDYVVMITTLGGMTAFGINGFVLGPVIAAMFMAVWHIRIQPE
ncbi:AI-2E family transporter [Rhodoferax sp.]|uniref:AI-2E family transporter n=1 Tax=Rhodoferax sp. TaxID=50421 RepID=UPI0028476BED|nr:AI-2E family transporter [Rhodoferax sp.]MDR3368991.1 AI-2E family transporter [Rhodoferax sp.]